MSADMVTGVFLGADLACLVLILLGKWPWMRS